MMGILFTVRLGGLLGPSQTPRTQVGSLNAGQQMEDFSHDHVPFLATTSKVPPHGNEYLHAIMNSRLGRYHILTHLL